MQTNERLAMARILIPYERFSGKRQEAGDSLRRQNDLIKQAAREEKVEIDWTLSLKDKGISAFRGKNWKRGDLGKFLDLVDAGVVAKGSILCIERVNRLSRMPWMKQVELWKEILERGIVIRTCVPPSRYTKENMNELAVGCPVVLFMMLGHMESQQKSDWAFEAFDAAKKRTRETGCPHGLNCPEWLTRVTEPHPKDPERNVTLRYEERPERVALLKWMHEQAQQGWGSGRIRKELIARRVPAWGVSGRWNVITITHYLTTRTAVGEHQPTRLDKDGVRRPDGPPIPDHYPEVITEDCWRRTQAARKGRAGRGGRISENATNLFTHLVYDACEENSVHLIHTCDNKKIKNPKQRLYLSLDGHPWTFPYRDFERAVLTTLAKLRASDVDGRHQADALAARVETLQAERSSLGLEVESLDRQMRELPPNKWPKRVVARIAELEEAVEAKDEELRKAKEAANASTRTQALTDVRSALHALDKAREDGRTKDEEAIRHRIKGRVPFLVESIWVRLQIVTKMSRYVHVRVYLHGGEQRYFVLPFGSPRTPALPLAGADFRGGEERGYTARTKAAASLVAG
jgi:hypothetical protein